MRKLTLIGIFTFSIPGCLEELIETNQDNNIADIDKL